MPETPPRDMTVAELRAALRDLPDDNPVRFAVNPLFPMSHGIATLTTTSDPTATAVAYLADSCTSTATPRPVAITLGWHEPATAPSRRRRTAR
ncbi:hypothetical protein [Streptomyces sp. NPDC005408]|uniref:hypothetical protein n=1 Tax=Streptomyces sp. NPDC005408 TaxID=3155341 RepID=UPI0033B99C2C